MQLIAMSSLSTVGNVTIVSLPLHASVISQPLWAFHRWMVAVPELSRMVTEFAQIIQIHNPLTPPVIMTRCHQYSSEEDRTTIT